jgi:hypothetical protein
MGGVQRGEVGAVIDRIDHADPTALPFIILLSLLLLAYGLYRIAKHVTRRRNRWLPDPKPDERDSVRQFKQMHRR